MSLDHQVLLNAIIFIKIYLLTFFLSFSLHAFPPPFFFFFLDVCFGLVCSVVGVRLRQGRGYGVSIVLFVKCIFYTVAAQ